MSHGTHWTEQVRHPFVTYVNDDNPTDTTHANDAKEELVAMVDATLTRCACFVPKGDHVKTRPLVHGGRAGYKIRP